MVDFQSPALWTISVDLRGGPAGSGQRFHTAGQSGTASERQTPPGGGESYAHSPDSGRWTSCLVPGQIECQTPQPAEPENINFSVTIWQPSFLCVTV